MLGLSKFRLNLPRICLPEMKKIESVLCKNFYKVFSKAYGKTELVNRATKLQ